MDITLKLHPSDSFKNKELRERFVTYVAALVNAGQDRKFEPYKLNASTTDREWSVDSGNDWWVFFDQDGDNSLVRIKHRGCNQAALKALTGWIAYNWRMTIVESEPVVG